MDTTTNIPLLDTLLLNPFYVAIALTVVVMIIVMYMYSKGQSIKTFIYVLITNIAVIFAHNKIMMNMYGENARDKDERLIVGSADMYNEDAVYITHENLEPEHSESFIDSDESLDNSVESLELLPVSII